MNLPLLLALSSLAVGATGQLARHYGHETSGQVLAGIQWLLLLAMAVALTYSAVTR